MDSRQRPQNESGGDTCMCVLAWHTPHVLEYTLRQLENEGIDAIVYANEVSDEERRVVRQFSNVVDFFESAQNDGNCAPRNRMLRAARDAGYEYVGVMDGDIGLARNAVAALRAAITLSGADAAYYHFDPKLQLTPERAQWMVAERQYLTKEIPSPQDCIGTPGAYVFWPAFCLMRSHVVDACLMPEFAPFDGPGWGFEDDVVQKQFAYARPRARACRLNMGPWLHMPYDGRFTTAGAARCGERQAASRFVRDVLMRGLRLWPLPKEIPLFQAQATLPGELKPAFKRYFPFIDFVGGETLRLERQPVADADEQEFDPRVGVGVEQMMFIDHAAGALHRLFVEGKLTAPQYDRPLVNGLPRIVFLVPHDAVHCGGVRAIRDFYEAIDDAGQFDVYWQLYDRERLDYALFHWPKDTHFIAAYGPDLPHLIARLQQNRLAVWVHTYNQRLTNEWADGHVLIAGSKLVAYLLRRDRPMARVTVLPPAVDASIAIDWPMANDAEGVAAHERFQRTWDPAERDVHVLAFTHKLSQYARRVIELLRPHVNVEVVDHYLPPEDMRDLFDRTRVVVYDSLEYFADYASISGTELLPLEAATHGCTVFMGCEGGQVEYVDQSWLRLLRWRSIDDDVKRILDAVATWQIHRCLIPLEYTPGHFREAAIRTASWIIDELGA